MHAAVVPSSDRPRSTPPDVSCADVGRAVTARSGGAAPAGTSTTGRAGTTDHLGGRAVA